MGAAERVKDLNKLLSQLLYILRAGGGNNEKGTGWANTHRQSRIYSE